MEIRDLVKRAIDILGERPTALLDAEILISYVLGVEREYIIAHADEVVEDALGKLFLSYIDRVKRGEPIAYITGEKEFNGLNFYVDSRVLIPRPETEHLVERVVSYLEKSDDGGERFRVLDVGTGSGNIAVSIAKHFGGEFGRLGEVLALEYDVGAAEVAKINVQNHNVEGLVLVRQSDLLECVDVGEKFDVIVANLPYIGKEGHFVSREAMEYEPNIALFGGESGLELYKKMFQQIVDKDVGYGIIVGEFGFAQGEDMSDLLNNFFGHKWVIDKDYAGIDRLFVITK